MEAEENDLLVVDREKKLLEILKPLVNQHWSNRQEVRTTWRTLLVLGHAAALATILNSLDSIISIENVSTNNMSVFAIFILLSGLMSLFVLVYYEHFTPDRIMWALRIRRDLARAYTEQDGEAIEFYSNEMKEFEKTRHIQKILSSLQLNDLQDADWTSLRKLRHRFNSGQASKIRILYILPTFLFAIGLITFSIGIAFGLLNDGSVEQLCL